MLTNDSKKYILNEYLRIIHHISDKQYQKRAWIKGEPPGTDFDETVCQFADIGDPILKNHQDFGITDSQYQILRKFRDIFGLFGKRMVGRLNSSIPLNGTRLLKWPKRY